MMEMPRIFISGIPIGTSSSDLMVLFNPYGAIRIVFTGNRHAFVDFLNISDAQRALSEVNGNDIMGQQISLGVAPSVSYTESCLIVRNLSPNVDWRELRNHMRQAGEVFFILLTPERGNEARVYYITRFAMLRAIELLNGSELGGTRIRLIPSEQELPGPSSSRQSPPSTSRSYSILRSLLNSNNSSDSSRSSSLQEQEISGINTRIRNVRIERDSAERSNPSMSDRSSRSRSSQSSSRAHNSDSTDQNWDGSSSISESSSYHLRRDAIRMPIRARSHSPTRSSSSSQEGPIRTSRPMRMEAGPDNTRRMNPSRRIQRRSRRRTRSRSLTAFKKRTRKNPPGTSCSHNMEAVRDDSTMRSRSRSTHRRSLSLPDSNEESNDSFNQTRDSSSSQSCHPKTSESSSAEAKIDELRLESCSPSSHHQSKSRSSSPSGTPTTIMDPETSQSCHPQTSDSSSAEAKIGEPRLGSCSPSSHQQSESRSSSPSGTPTIIMDYETSQSCHPQTSDSSSAEAKIDEPRLGSCSSSSHQQSESRSSSPSGTPTTTMDYETSQSCHPQTSDSSSAKAKIDEPRLGSCSSSSHQQSESRSSSPSGTPTTTMDCETSQNIVDREASGDEPRPTAPQDFAIASTSGVGSTSSHRRDRHSHNDCFPQMSPNVFRLYRSKSDSLSQSEESRDDSRGTSSSYSGPERKPVKRVLPMSSSHGKRLRSDENLNGYRNRWDIPPPPSADAVHEQNESRHSIPSCSTSSPSRFRDRTHPSLEVVPWFERQGDSRYRRNSLGLIQERLRVRSLTPQRGSMLRNHSESDDILSMFKWRLICRSEDELIGYFGTRSINRVRSTNSISAPSSPSASVEENPDRPIPSTSAKKAPKRSSSMPHLSKKPKRGRRSGRRYSFRRWSNFRSFSNSSSSSSSSSSSNSSSSE